MLYIKKKIPRKTNAAFSGGNTVFIIFIFQVEEPDDWLRFGNPWEKGKPISKCTDPTLPYLEST